MKFAEINKIYTDTVARYMDYGYTIFATTMAGSQGEIAKIDMVKDNRILRVLVETFTDCDGEMLDGVKIRAGFAPDPADRFSINGWDTIWNSRLSTIFEQSFYRIGEDRRTGTEYGTKEEAVAANRIHLSRYRARRRVSDTDYVDRKRMEIAVRFIKRATGKTKVNPAHIQLRKTHGHYNVSYRGTMYRLK